MKSIILESKIKNVFWSYLILALVSIVVFAFLVFGLVSFHRSLKSKKNNVALELANSEKKFSELKVYVEEKKKAQNVFLKLNAFAQNSNKDLIKLFLNDVTDLLPENTFLNDFTLNKDIKVHGFSNSIKNILDLLVNISHLPYIYTGRVVKLNKDLNGSPFIEFFLNFDIKPLKESNAKN